MLAAIPDFRKSGGTFDSRSEPPEVNCDYRKSWLAANDSRGSRTNIEHLGQQSTRVFTIVDNGDYRQELVQKMLGSVQL
jgi:hypothetical protein